MKFSQNKSVLLIALICASFSSFNIKAQEDDSQPLDTAQIQSEYKHKGFHAGLIVGAYWANKNTAYLYDGYGFDENGQRNTFGNSILYNQIVNVYGGRKGGTDQIAQLLNVNTTDWYFNEQDMPINLKYTVAYLVGLNTRYQINKKSNIMLNINSSKIIVNGKFTISSMNSTNGFTTQTKQNQFTITGAEQRLSFQLGYQRIFGKSEKFNLMAEGGMNIILSKVQKNQAFLTTDRNNGQDNIYIDLMSAYSVAPYNYYAAKYFIGAGIGAFAGLGFQLCLNPKYTVQLLYQPSYDRISLGYTPQFKMQNGVGLRFYYNLSTI